MCKAHYKINDWTTEAKLLLTLTTKPSGHEFDPRDRKIFV